MPLKVTLFQKIRSYIVPVSILKTKSKYNASLEVTVENGKLVLNSANANYSYGSLFKVFKKAFKIYKINFDKVNNVLMLGMGAGSVVKFIAEQNFRIKIDAVEIDESVIAIAEQVFDLNKISAINIIHNDAQGFLNDCDKKYDLILVDLFIDNKVPLFCFEEVFIKKLASITTPSSKIIFNTNMNSEENPAKLLLVYPKFFSKTSLTTIRGNRILYAEPQTNS